MQPPQRPEPTAEPAPVLDPEAERVLGEALIRMAEHVAEKRQRLVEAEAGAR